MGKRERKKLEEEERQSDGETMRSWLCRSRRFAVTRMPPACALELGVI